MVKRVTMLCLLVVAMLPLLTEAFFMSPGLFGGSSLGGSSKEASTEKKKPKSQAEKLESPWLWITVVAFTVAMLSCLRISFQGKW